MLRAEERSWLIADVSIECGTDEHCKLRALRWPSHSIRLAFFFSTRRCYGMHATRLNLVPNELSRAPAFLHSEYKPHLLCAAYSSGPLISPPHRIDRTQRLLWQLVGAHGNGASLPAGWPLCRVALPPGTSHAAGLRRRRGDGIPHGLAQAAPHRSLADNALALGCSFSLHPLDVLRVHKFSSLIEPKNSRLVCRSNSAGTTGLRPSRSPAFHRVHLWDPRRHRFVACS